MDLGAGAQGPLAPVGPQKFSRPPSGFLLRGRMRSGGTPVARHRATDSSSGGSPASASPAQVVAHTRSGLIPGAW